MVQGLQSRGVPLSINIDLWNRNSEAVKGIDKASHFSRIYKERAGMKAINGLAHNSKVYR